MKTLRVGLIGCGTHATQAVHPAARTLAELDLVACCDQQPERAAQTARRFGIPRTYTDHIKLLENEKLDACLVVVDPDRHYSLTLDCLKHGVNVFVEKPPARTVEQCQEMLKLSAAYKKIVMPALMMRFRPIHTRVKELIGRMDERPLGFTYKLATGAYMGRVPQCPASLELLLDAGIHAFDLAHWLFGPIQRVAAEKYEYDATRVLFTIQLHFERGGGGLLNVNSCESWGRITDSELTCHPSEWLEIVGAGSAIRLDNCQRLTSYRKDGVAEYFEPNYSMISFHEKQQYYLGGYCHELKHFAECVLTNKTPSVTMEDAQRAIAAVYAVWRSAQEHDYVELPRFQSLVNHAQIARNNA